MSDKKAPGLLFENKPGKKEETAETAVAKIDRRPTTAMDLLQMVTQSGASVEVINTIAALYEKDRDDWRRMAFNAAMSEAQSEIQRIAPDAQNPHTKSRYATYATLDKFVRPIYTKHGFGLSFNTIDTESTEILYVTCCVSHKDGWSQEFKIPIPASGLGAKGGQVQNGTQAVGSALSYGKRYLLIMIFNLAIGIDDDGNAAGGFTAITPEQAEILRGMAQATGTPEELIYKAYGVTSLEGIPLKMFEPAIKILQRKVDSKGGK